MLFLSFSQTNLPISRLEMTISERVQYLRIIAMHWTQDENCVCIRRLMYVQFTSCVQDEFSIDTTSHERKSMLNI